jgi:alanine-synthesizing transaminase
LIRKLVSRSTEQLVNVFSSRLPSLSPNALARAIERVRARGTPLIDLTISNPTSAELAYPQDVLSALADPRGLRYEPDARGLTSAREAIARAIGASVDRDRLLLTASTSEAYALLFKLLCNPGESVLVPQPSYPLFDLLTGLEGVTPRPYRLEYHGVWSIDRDSVTRALLPDVRAILVVSPNNPTGAFVRAADRDWLAALAADRNLAIISDEVFAEYPLRKRPDASSFMNESRALTFALGGLSKSAGLPQVKLGWIVASGPDAEVRQALERLEVIADMYLSVSTPVQIAAPALLAAGSSMRAAIQTRLTQNLAALQSRCERWPGIDVLEPEGGWTAVMRVPATTSEEALVIRLLEEAGVLVHPGYFFDFPQEAFLAVSLLTPSAAFDAGIDRVLPVAAGDAA